MVCCLFFSGDPIANDPRNNRKNSFKLNLHNICTEYRDQPRKLLLCCCVTAPCIGSCVAVGFRNMVLDSDMTKYQFFQGYSLPCCCCRISGKTDAFRQYQNLCCEACCCPGASISASRMYVMDIWDIKPDHIDNRSTRMAACIVDCLTMCIPECKERPQMNMKAMAKNACNAIASSIFNSVFKGCMVVQVINTSYVFSFPLLFFLHP